MRSFTLLIFTLFFTACGQENSSTPDGQQINLLDDQGLLPTIAKLRWYKTQWHKSWSISLKKDIEATNIDSVALSLPDLKRLNCIGYNQASASQRQNFWIVLMASIAASESAFNPRLRYYETSLKQYSEGLLQLSLSDKSSDQFCRGLNSDSILTASQNLRCGLSIMHRQIRGNQRRGISPGTIFPKRPYYWSVLTASKSQIKVIDFFKSHLSQLTFC